MICRALARLRAGVQPTTENAERRSALHAVAYAGVRLTVHLFIRFRLWGHIRIHGRQHISRSGGLLVASNHLGAADPPLLSVTFGRRLHFLAMDDLFDNRAFGFLLRSGRAIPIRRNHADRRALRQALTLLRSGEALAIYPEGGRSMAADLEPPKPGAGYLALLANVPILPVGMAGTERMFPRVPMRPRQRGIDVVFGEPFRLPTHIRDPQVAAEYIMTRIAALIPWQYRGYLRAADNATAADPDQPATASAAT